MSDYLTTLRYQQKLAQLKREHPAAVMKGLHKCIRCGICCWHSPAQLTREDLERLARHHYMTPATYFDAYCTVSIINEQLSVVLIRGNQHSYAGRELPESERLSLDAPCLYLGKDGCEIHAYKPAQCVRAKCWKRNEIEDVEWKVEELRGLGFNATHNE